MIKKQSAIKAIVIFLIALFLIGSTLYSGENVVLTNNGDFNRVISLCSLSPDASGGYKISIQERDFWGNLHQILFTPEDTSVYPSAQLIFVRLSVALSYTVNTLTGNLLDVYHPGCLSIPLSLLYALALTFAFVQIDIKNKYCFWIFTVISLVMLCDIGYVSYFNSLYAEGLQHILLIALLGFFIRSWKQPTGIWETLGFSVVLMLFGQSKFFNIPLAIVFALLALLISFRHSLGKRGIVIKSAATVAVIAVLLNTYSVLPEWMSKETNYNSVFFGIVKDCDDASAKEYLKDLHLDTGMYALKNTHHYVSNFSELQSRYPVGEAENISKLRLLSFYAKHPGVTFHKLGEIADHCSHIRNIFFMDEAFMEDLTRCSFWSKIREQAGFDTLTLNFLVILGLFALLVFVCYKSGTGRYITVLSAFLIFCGFAYAFFVPYVSNGEADLAKHMYLFIELVDLALIGILGLSLQMPKRIKQMTAGILLFVIVCNLIPNKRMETLSFGGYQWYVISENQDYKTLLAKEVITDKSYHSQPDNHYQSSDIHRWLNETFLKEFSQSERDALYQKEEKMLLSSAYVSEAEGGNRDFYCSAFPKRVNTSGADAYYQTVSAYVFLPTAEQISQMANNGYGVAIKEKYWLSTPYFNNGTKARYVNPDGLVYFAQTDEILGIRPVIYLKKSQS